MSPKKAVVVVLAVAAGQPEWPSTLQWEKYIQISILNANIIIIRLVYQNACPHNKTKRLLASRNHRNQNFFQGLLNFCKHNNERPFSENTMQQNYRDELCLCQSVISAIINYL